MASPTLPMSEGGLAQVAINLAPALTMTRGKDIKPSSWLRTIIAVCNICGINGQGTPTITTQSGEREWPRCRRRYKV